MAKLHQRTLNEAEQANEEALKKYWEEDAERVNEMARIARKLGITAKAPPKPKDDEAKE